MDQDKNLLEDGQTNVITRSTARHLRRKRLNEARRARNQFLDDFINGVDEKINQETEVNSDSEKSKLTKSKARRLRKKEKAKLLECCCCDTSVVSTNFLHLEPNCCIKSNQNTFNSHLNNVQHIEDFFTQSLLSLGNHKKTIRKSEDTIECEYNYNKQDINSSRSYLTKLVNFDSEDLSDSSQIVIFSGLPKSINKEEQTHCTKNSSGIKRSYLESCNIKVVQSSDTSFPVSDNSSRPNYLFIPNSIYKDHQEENKNISLNDQTLENIVRSETCPLKYEEDNYSSLVIQEISEEPSNIEKTSQDSIVQREPLEESKELILPVNATLNNLVSTKNEQSNKIMDSKASGTVKTREEIKAEREARKAAKAANKGKGKVAANTSDKQNIPIKVDNISNDNEKQKTNNVIISESNDLSVTENNSNNTMTEDSTVNIKSEGKSNAILLEKNNKSSLVVQNLSEESSDIEKTSQVSLVQREPLEESTELILPVSSTLDISVPTKNEQSNKIMDSKASGMVKTKEEIKAEREARKAAKAANKGKGKVAANKSDKQNISIKVDNISNDNEKQKANNVIISESNDMSVTENNSNNTMTEDSIVNIKSEGKSKAELRAERRAKQEAQRAAKQEAQRTAKQEQIGEKMKVKSKPNMIQPNAIVTATADHPVDNKTNKIIKKTTKNDTHEVNLFKHLYHERELALDKVSTSNFNIHPAIQKLGVQYENKIIVGSNARCVAFLVAIKQLIGDFDKPLKTDFTRGLETKLQESVSYLHACRPLAVSMQNALRHLKWQMTQLDSTSSDADAKHKLRSLIDTYIVEQIHLADESISIFIQTKISNGNVILTYGYSSLIEKILTDAHKAGKQFRVIIVDGRPWLEGKEQLRRLATYGIDCSYVLINALSFVMPEVSKVFLGAHAILANGAVMSRIGTAQVALMAKSFNVPVLVACETHKSCERVQTDSIVHNELGNVDDLTKSTYRNSNKSLLYNWRSKKCLNLLNITYDVTPADLVTAVVTELAILPCTSVPVILRIKPSEI
ncbi:PREDICTED: probable cyclin-dependent serine/threonine-protein kinase DDB_G0292550 isoform X1 [Polistes canadensis]|uniref:probable cyclin-dependent serine/threonine-protein kinase DDB_G0292550 isoform X1 n=1 Tax=Polistes canadensis TaxID=91411 RepID=UPI0007190543|nr:PREDICTED: probable cyclin-dependent serine/threonine-protein kinase DDB_G0292550 isoform X1 [Polistes canadensis]XP_014613863.1 PREDICTED: probable cyclin-dependent serine/threonine-protein kinase DDB_G0292550 isoform X1 [Polistes canadensis]